MVHAGFRKERINSGVLCVCETESVLRGGETADNKVLSERKEREVKW